MRRASLSKGWRYGPWIGWTPPWTNCVDGTSGEPVLSLLVIAACLASGALIGFMGGALGIGGGLIAIPALGLLLGMPQQLAQGTALIMVLPAPWCSRGSARNWRWASPRARCA
ncbi:membrane protein [Bordetella pertussis]|nr:membrane protein [Bordetella pertussis]